MYLDEIAPDFDKKEIHEIEIRASASEVYDAVWRLDLGRSKIVRLLMRLRGMPPESMTLKGLVGLGFNVLVDDTPRELVMGLAGKFWMSKPEMPDLSVSSFANFDKPGCAKAAWNFYLEQMDESRVRLRTETRIACTDEKSRRLFSCYWFIIRPFSGWIRRKMLRIIKDDAESR